MRIGIAEARDFITACFGNVGLSESEAAIVSDQIIDIELRGSHFGGFSRALTMCRIILSPGHRFEPMRIVRETPLSAQINGGNFVGYVVATRATEIAIEKAKAQGLAIVGLNNTYYTGQFAYYMEMITRAKLVGIAFGSSKPMVAPHGSTEARFGTNPIAFGFPSETTPVIVDIGTSAVMLGDLNLWEKLGIPLAKGIGFDRNGEETTDPASAREGAVAVWGGHKGSALAIAVQLFGLMAGSDPDSIHCGMTVIAIDPALFGDPATFIAQVQAYAETISKARPIEPAQPPRIPFSRSAAERQKQLERGWIEVPDVIVAQLQGIAGYRPEVLEH